MWSRSVQLLWYMKVKLTELLAMSIAIMQILKDLITRVQQQTMYLWTMVSDCSKGRWTLHWYRNSQKSPRQPKNQCLLQNCSKSFNWHFTQVECNVRSPILMVCWGHLVHKYTDDPITSSFRLCINMPSWHCLQKKKATSKILTCLLLTASSSSSFKDSERIRDTILSLRMAKSIFLTTFSKARQSESLTNKMWSTQAPKDSSPQVISQ